MKCVGNCHAEEKERKKTKEKAKKGGWLPYLRLKIALTFDSEEYKHVIEDH